MTNNTRRIVAAAGGLGVASRRDDRAPARVTEQRDREAVRTADVRRRAVRHLASRAHDADDLRQLLTALDLTAQEGRP